MLTMTRGAAAGGLLALLIATGCGDSPTQPSVQLPATYEMTANQTVSVDGTNLTITLDVPPSPCGPNASCVAWYGARLISRADGAQPVTLEVPHDGRPAAQRVGRYTVSFVGFVWEPARIKVLVEGS
jgi:hypothetical protein